MADNTVIAMTPKSIKLEVTIHKNVSNDEIRSSNSIFVTL